MIDVLIHTKRESEPIKNKNIFKIQKKELIYFKIQTVKKLRKIPKNVVTTNSKKIEKVTKLYGAEVPLIRSKKYVDIDIKYDLRVERKYS